MVVCHGVCRGVTRHLCAWVEVSRGDRQGEGEGGAGGGAGAQKKRTKGPGLMRGLAFLFVARETSPENPILILDQY